MQLVEEADLRRLVPGQRLLIRIVTDGDRVAFHKADSAEATHQLTLLAGLPFVTFLPERDTVLSREVTSRGYWELPESALLLALIRPGMTVVDAGANIGYYTVLIARCLGSTGTVHAFEPEPDNFETLLANTLLAQRILRDPPQINILRRAFSDRCGTARFHRYAGNLGFHSLTYADGSATDVIEVDTVTLDQLRGLAGVPASITRPINVLKADLQGAELQLLRGGAQTIRNDRPMLCLEFEPYIGGHAMCLEMIDWLEHHGYRNFRVFHSNQTEPAELLAELSRNHSGADVKSLVKSGAIGAFGTVFTWNG
jgi:FkbM family methyltransferase